MRSTKKNAEQGSKSTQFILANLIINDYDPSQQQHDAAPTMSGSGSNQIPSPPNFKPSPPSSRSNSQSELNGFEILPPAEPPLRHRRYEDYERISGNLSRSFHDIFKMKKLTSSEDKPSGLYFFKQNKYDKIDPFMYELEATSCGFYHFLAPDFAPTARALYNKLHQCIGIAVKNLPGFKPTLDDPLQERDLQLELLNHVTIHDLEELDERARLENTDIDNLPDSQVIHIILKRENSSSASKRIKVTAGDLRHYRIVKGLGIGLTLSHIFEEDDNHTGNMSKDGKRIDMDMSPWPIHYLFKKTGPVDWAFRDPAGRFNVTARDIDQFPNLQDAQPFYWPTIPVRVLPEAFIQVASQFFQVSRNAFHSKDNAIYRQLEKHPVFVYHKYATILKYILTNKKDYRTISELNIRKELSFQGKNIIEMQEEHQEQRLTEFRNAVKQLPSFKEFLEQHGDYVIKNIILDFAIHNDKCEKKISKSSIYKDHIVDLSAMIDKYADICAEVRISKNQDRIKQHPELSDLITHNQEVIQGEATLTL